MKQQLLASAAIVALVAATPALAAPPPPPIYNWTGFYVGGNVGYSWGNSDGNFTDPGFINGFGNFDGEGRTGLPGIFRTTTKPDGLIGGAQVGYNWQISPMGLIGVEADWQKSAEKANAAFSNNYTCDFEGIIQCTLSQTRQASIDWFSTVRGRVGVLINPTTLVYGTAGFAFGQVSASGTFSDDINNTGINFGYGTSRINAGFAVGTGIEGAFASSRWTWKVEYLYVDLGSLRGSGLNPITGNTYTWDAKFYDNIIRVGLNYRINP
jgi:outer membrane immunogenic protein